MKQYLHAGLILATSMAAMAANAVVLRPVADMYSRPTESADVVSQAIYGTNVNILEEHNNWARVRTPDAYTGWMHRANLKQADRQYATGNFVAVTTLFANVYREPDVTKHKPVITLPFETRLERVGEGQQEGERWLQVRLVDGQQAYIQAGDVGNPKQMTVAEMVAFSHRFKGLPYLWGGTSTYGFDCSGFTQMLERQRGVVMPRDADMQAAWNGVTDVSRHELRPGDLLFFGHGQKITHTGMYVGNGEFINATTHDHPVIQVDRLADPHWTKLFVCARRVK